MTRNVFLFVLVFFLAFSAAAQKPSKYDEGVQDPAIEKLTTTNDSQEKAIRTIVGSNDAQDRAISALIKDVDGLKSKPAPAPNPSATPAPSPSAVVPPGTATRGWVSKNFASLPDDFDLASFYLAAGLSPVQARSRLADKLGDLRKHGKPVYMQIAFAIMADAISVARTNSTRPTFTESDYEKIAFDVVGHIRPEDLLTKELVALVEARAGAKATEVAKKEAEVLHARALEIVGLAKSTNELLLSRATAVDELKTLACNLQGFLEKYQADVERFATVEVLDHDAVHKIVDEALGPVQETLAAVKARQKQIETAFVTVANAIGTKDTEGKEKKRIRATAAAQVTALGYIITP